MAIPPLLSPKLDEIRRQSQQQGKFSWTSAQYQADVLDLVYDKRKSGSAVIEVGCYKGGLTVQLALVCKEIGAHLYSMDIDRTATLSARDLLKNCNLLDVATIYDGTLASFARAMRAIPKPIVCILDGDHSYPAVRSDLKAVEALASRPAALVFHDYSLRHPTTDERVDEALRDHFGKDSRPRPIGQQMNGTAHATQQNPQPDGHYWQVPGSEGAILLLDADS